MEPPHPSEVTHSLSMLPGYPNVILGRRTWMIVISQVAFCIVSSMYLSYVLYKKYYPRGKKSWKTTVEMVIPITKRLENLEKERVIWNSYLEWMEDYCSVYYGLLHYLNSTVTTMNKLEKGLDCTVKKLSGSISQSEIESSKGGESQREDGLTSETSCDKMVSEDDELLKSNFTRAFANLKAGNGDVKRDVVDSSSAISSDIVSGNDEFCNEEKESHRETSDDDAKIVEYMEMLYLEKKNMCSQYRALYPVLENLEVAQET